MCDFSASKKQRINYKKMKIEKKIQKWSFDKILSGEKTFELRLADWNCNAGDILVLREIDDQRNYTGRIVEKKNNLCFKNQGC